MGVVINASLGILNGMKLEGEVLEFFRECGRRGGRAGTGNSKIHGAKNLARWQAKKALGLIPPKRRKPKQKELPFSKPEGGSA